MADNPDLAPEWLRIQLLGTCLGFDRRGEEIPEEIKRRLGEVQRSVTALREQPPWQGLSRARGLASIDQDILACTVAPVAEPRIGWMYQDFQGGIGSAYPTPALIRELLFLDEQENRHLHERLSRTAPLLRTCLVEGSSSDPYAPVRPTRRACMALLGWQAGSAEAPPGAIEITAPGTWDDLVLPHYCLKALREYLLWITQRDKVISEWGGRAVGGPVALFTGPSGTGKTFSATVLANALGWPLYRVDLGLLVSKYVGETEKNLNALFDAADGQPMVLLFDEAESLFGKRGEIKEARDRYANMEVSHLLTRIERHQGPCILTSNAGQQLDPAFARRFQAVIEFPRPDAALRPELWRKHLPPFAPYALDVDAERLGQTLELTGGQIRNAALHAAFLAAGESSPISLYHIVNAVWTELAKAGRTVGPSALGSLAVHLRRNSSHATN